MIKKIIALCLVLTLVSVAFTGCKKDPEPVKPDTSETDHVEGDGEDHTGHNHD